MTRKDSQLEMAQAAYRSFVCDRQVDGRIDKWPTKCPVPVPCHKAVDAFLTRHPEYSEFRNELLNVYREEEAFRFVEDWQ